MKSMHKLVFFSLLAISLLAGAGTEARAQYIGAESHDSKVVETVAPTNSTTAAQSASQAEGRGNHTTTTVFMGGVPTAATVRVNNLAMLEALINIGGQCAEIVGILWGAGLLFACFRKMGQPQLAKSIAFALLPIILGLCTPASFDWVTQQMKDDGGFR